LEKHLDDRVNELHRVVSAREPEDRFDLPGAAHENKPVPRTSQALGGLEQDAHAAEVHEVKAAEVEHDQLGIGLRVAQ
jgi:hypothetical protein